MADAEFESARVLSVTSLLRTIGTIGRPSGRGLFMFRAMVTCASSAALVGLCGAMVSGMLLLGGGQGFLLGSCVGWVGAAWSFYRSQFREAALAFDDFPELMRLHLVRNFPDRTHFHRVRLDTPPRREAERDRLLASWAESSMLASAYQTAMPAIDEIYARREQAAINEHAREIES